ncbi:hypothetical protein [Aeromonas sp. MR16]|uniref:hypothetical protein n=1 Tax=Aeromonas sp. MR16 TaxID=2923420 RepID=UPI001F4AF1F2|nr:hypothetical protein [Aeromonas sp. MR16]MCH7371013.1 hypothetical protein [Aeromonas sp. MR16]
MYLTLGIVTLIFIISVKKSRVKYRARAHKLPKIYHGALLLIVNALFEFIYRQFFVSQHDIDESVFVTYWLPQIIYYLCLITVLLVLSFLYGLFIWPDGKNEVNKNHSFNIPILFLLSLFIFYPSLGRQELVEISPFMLAMILVADGFTSLYLVRMLVIKFNK